MHGSVILVSKCNRTSYDKSCYQQQLIPNTPLCVCSDVVTPAKYVRDLGMYIDCDMSMKTQVTRTVSSCFSALRQIRRSVSRPVLLSLVTSLVLARLDYGISTLIGISRHLLDRLQSVLNAVARLVLTAVKYDHITPLLRELHWLRVPERQVSPARSTRCLKKFLPLHSL